MKTKPDKHGWLPIETAPRDSNDYQLYCADTREQMVGFRIGEGEYQFAVIRYTGNQIQAVCRPTHWKPLSKPPEAP